MSFIFTEIKVAGGSAAKNYGGRRVLTLAVLLWSLSSFLTPFFASSWQLMILFRFFLGVGEGIGVFWILLGKYFHHVMCLGLVFIQDCLQYFIFSPIPFPWTNVAEPSVI